MFIPLWILFAGFLQKSIMIEVRIYILNIYRAGSVRLRLCLAFIISTCIHQNQSAQSQQHCELKQWEKENISAIVTRQPNRTETTNRQAITFSGHLVVIFIFMLLLLLLLLVFFLFIIFNSPVRLKTNKMKLINWTYLLPLSYFISTCCCRSSFNRWAKSTHTQ